jgi:hypothetical protein
LLKTIVAVYPPGASEAAPEFTVKVIVVGELVAVPEVDDAVSQLGMKEIEYATFPLPELKV